MEKTIQTQQVMMDSTCDFFVKSESNTEVEYHVSDVDGYMKCECKAFQFRHFCKHIQQVKNYQKTKEYQSALECEALDEMKSGVFG